MSVNPPEICSSLLVFPLHLSLTCGVPVWKSCSCPTPLVFDSDAANFSIPLELGHTSSLADIQPIRRKSIKEYFSKGFYEDTFEDFISYEADWIKSKLKLIIKEIIVTDLYRYYIYR